MAEGRDHQPVRVVRIDPDPADVTGIRKSREWLGWIIAAVLLLGIVVMSTFTISYLRQKPPAEAVAARFTIAPPEKATFGQITISPDGRSLAFNADVEGKNQLWLRPLDSLTTRPLPKTEGTNSFPFWSPDSRSIAFRLGEKLNTMDLANGTSQTVCNIPSGSKGWGGTWSREGTILFNGGRTIYRVSAAGGESAPVPGLDQPRQGVEYRWPSFLPDGRHFLYLVTTAGQETSEVYFTSLDGKETKRLLTADSSAIYAASAAGGGYLLFARAEALEIERGVWIDKAFALRARGGSAGATVRREQSHAHGRGISRRRSGASHQQPGGLFRLGQRHPDLRSARQYR
jgi:Tol biopolymer transport system component